MYWQVYYHPTSRAYEVILEKIYTRVQDLLNENHVFNADVSMLKRFIYNNEDYEAFLEIDDFYMNGLILSFKHSDDDILRELANDFLNRKIWSYIDEKPENKTTIQKIKNSYPEGKSKYYTTSRTVKNSTYKDDTKQFGENIDILTSDNKIVSLIDISKIIESLTLSGTKEDPKFFYKVR